VIALDAKTGEQLWAFNAIREGMRAGGRRGSCRVGACPTDR
jgi:hypothetical protein